MGVLIINVQCQQLSPLIAEYDPPKKANFHVGSQVSTFGFKCTTKILLSVHALSLLLTIGTGTPLLHRHPSEVSVHVHRVNSAESAFQQHTSLFSGGGGFA